MDARARRLRKAMERLGRKRRNERVPRALRVELVGSARMQRRAGRSWRSIAEALGVSSSGLQRWCAAPQPPGATLRRVRLRVEARSCALSQSLVLVTASGHRVEGLAVADAVVLMRALA